MNDTRYQRDELPPEIKSGFCLLRPDGRWITTQRTDGEDALVIWPTRDEARKFADEQCPDAVEHDVDQVVLDMLDEQQIGICFTGNVARF